MASRETFEGIGELKYPADKARIRRLTLAEKQVWYAGQDPHVHVESGVDFQRFWRHTYLWPLKLKRALYVLKFW